MKKIFLILFVLISQLINANWLTNFEEAKKVSLATNKFMIVDFWASWCGPCKKMDYNSWSDASVNAILENYIQVKINIDLDRELANKYGINSIPNMFVMDGNGMVVHSFSGYQSACELKKELEKFEISTEFLSVDLVNFYKNNNYNTALRVFQKYLDYSLFVDKEIKNKILKIGNDYFSKVRKMVSKKMENYDEIKQKIDLLELYNYAYDYNYDKLSIKLLNINKNVILENNLNNYYFLKLITAKGLGSEDRVKIEEETIKLENFSYYARKIDLILSKRSD
jgi:thiol-disulfide isomerase/thioredoxin